MPIYEFLCKSCSRQFEVLVLPWLQGTADTPACPSCQGRDVERMLSSFAVSSESTRQSNLADGRRHQAKDFREKQDAEHKEMIEHAREHE